ncbi:MAG: hypothetical protein EPN86_00530 [Nanoarchaeota archaeon]|nr:MAG: hypothetical protein EPN86_00530 [Nanoarchaeota archaeon]
MNLVGPTPYGLKEISGKENLEGIAKDAVFVFLPPHICEGDYAIGPFLEHEGIPSGHFDAGKNLVTTPDGRKPRWLMRALFDSNDIILIDRDLMEGEPDPKNRTRKRNYGMTYFRLFAEMLSEGGNGTLFPGKTRDRTGNYVSIGNDDVLGLLISAQKRVSRTIYAIPISVTWDRIYRADEKVIQNVTGYKRQDATDLEPRSLELLAWTLTSPFYVNVGKPIKVSDYVNGKKGDAKQVLLAEYNDALREGMYVTPTNLASSAFKSLMPFDGGVVELANEVKMRAEQMVERGSEPFTDEDYFALSAIAVGNQWVSTDELVDAMEQRLKVLHGYGTHVASIVTDSPVRNVLNIAHRDGGLRDFAKYDRQNDRWMLSNGLLMSYYATSLDMRLDHIAKSSECEPPSLEKALQPA